jgi:hypothetical protein
MLKLAGRIRPVSSMPSPRASVTTLISAIRTDASCVVLVRRQIDDPQSIWEYSTVPAPRAERDDIRYLNLLRTYGWQPMFDGPSAEEVFMIEHAWDHIHPIAALQDRLNDMYEPHVLDEVMPLYRFVEDPFSTPTRD